MCPNNLNFGNPGSRPGQRQRCQRPQSDLRILDCVFDDLDNVLKLGAASVANGLVHPTLTGGDSDTFGAEAGEGEGHFLPVAATHGVGEDVDFGVGGGSEGVEGGLGDADVGFDADEDDFSQRRRGGRGGIRRRRRGFWGRKVLCQGGKPHAEQGLVDLGFA